MIFDESHFAKSAYKGGKQSTAGKRIMRLQFNYPRSRVVYSSATAASEVDHLLILTRLQLWGNGTAYVDSKDFRKKLAQRGVAGLEQMSMELKLDGKYLSRQLSFERVNVDLKVVELSDGITLAYERATQLVRTLL